VVGAATDPDLVLVATGSEVALAMAAAGQLADRGVAARVVSMPWRERFLGLAAEDRWRLLPPGVPVLVVEAGVAQGWDAVARDQGAVMAIDRYGASGRGTAVQEELGFSVVEVVRRALDLLSTGTLISTAAFSREAS
jgi:transketolase